MHISSLFTESTNSLHIQKRLYLSSGAFHDFIVYTGIIKSIILTGKLKLNPNAINNTHQSFHLKYYWSKTFYSGML